MNISPLGAMGSPAGGEQYTSMPSISSSSTAPRSSRPRQQCSRGLSGINDAKRVAPIGDRRGGTLARADVVPPIPAVSPRHPSRGPPRRQPCAQGDDAQALQDTPGSMGRVPTITPRRSQRAIAAPADFQAKRCPQRRSDDALRLDTAVRPVAQERRPARSPSEHRGAPWPSPHFAARTQRTRRPPEHSTPVGYGRWRDCGRTDRAHNRLEISPQILRGFHNKR